MIVASFFLLSLICVWAIVRPIMIGESEVKYQDGLSEIQYSERNDLQRFLESLEFERARGLIGEDEYIKQQAKVKKRLGKIVGEDA